MRALFIDTSALLAFLDRSDTHHPRSVAAITDTSTDPVTHSYVGVEVQARLGREALRVLVERVLAAIEVHAVSDEVHTSALRELMAAETTRISFVDRTSFSFMRTEGLEVAIVFDRDFEREGFTVVP